jgi:large conductance mechanosensitive channel
VIDAEPRFWSRRVRGLQILLRRSFSIVRLHVLARRTRGLRSSGLDRRFEHDGRCLWQEFKAFAVRGNVLDLAVAVVIGAAFTKIVTALVNEVVMPLIGKVMPTGDWIGYQVGGIKIGVVFSAVLDFLVVAAVLFVVVVKIMGSTMRRFSRDQVPVPPPTKKCPECLEDIPVAARRCRACTSQQLS